MITRTNLRKISIQTSVVLTALFLMAGCGGGSTDSGGGDMVPFALSTFTGTYDTIVYEGSITIRLVSSTMAAIQITGIPCLQSEFTVELFSRTNEFNVSGLIRGQPSNPNSLGPPSITMLWPMSGGTGTLILDPGSNCVPSEGTINVTRS